MIVVAVTGLNAWQGFKPYEYTYGLYGFGAGSSGAEIIRVTGAEAMAKGMRTGDSILAIDGVSIDRIGTDWLAVRQALIREEGETIILNVRDAKGQVRAHRLTSRAENTRPDQRSRWLGVALDLAGSLAFLCAATLLFRRRREPVPALLSLGFLMLLVAPTTAVNIWLDQSWLFPAVSYVPILGVTLFLLGLLAFPDGKMSRTAWTITGVIIVWAASMSALPTSIVDIAMVPAFVVLLIAVLLRQVLRYRRSPQGITRQQVRWGIFGFAVGGAFLIIGLCANFAADRIDGLTYYLLADAGAIAGNLSFLFIAGGLVVSLMRYRLYDADTVIGRSAAYGVLTLGFLALFGGSQKVIEALGEIYFGEQAGALAGAIGAALAAVLVVPLHRRANEWAERRFQKELLRLRRGLPDMVGNLRETAPSELIAETVTEAAALGVQAIRAAVLVGNSVIGTYGVSPAIVSDWSAKISFESDDDKTAGTDQLFPTRVALDAHGAGRVGWLLLGPHPDGSALGKDERAALSEIAEPVARALVIAETRYGEKRELRSMFERLEQRLQALERIRSQESGEAPALV